MDYSVIDYLPTLLLSDAKFQHLVQARCNFKKASWSNVSFQQLCPSRRKVFLGILVAPEQFSPHMNCHSPRFTVTHDGYHNLKSLVPLCWAIDAPKFHFVWQVLLSLLIHSGWWRPGCRTALLVPTVFIYNTRDFCILCPCVYAGVCMRVCVRVRIVPFDAGRA